MVIIGLVISILFTLSIIGEYFFDQLEIRDKIDECQQELPRNETCKIIAIPDEGDIDE